MTHYYVIGGEYQDTTFKAPLGEMEKYGPFTDIEEARAVWKDKSMSKIDNCMVRYVLIQDDEKESD